MLRDDDRRGRRTAAAGAAVLLLTAWLGVAGVLPASAAAPPVGTTPAGIERLTIVQPSTVTYRVGETFLTGKRFNMAVGTTHAVQGDVYVDRAHPSNSRVGSITVDISTFQSDKGRRDEAIRSKWLESSKYPTAVFTPTAIRGLPASYAEGQEVPVQILGTLRVRDVTKPETFAGTIKLTGHTLTGSVQTSILMTDFGFDPPSILGVLKAENQAQLELEFTAQPPEG
ncbi:MAG TPA: YceI family protein [bacterium]|nr:YceI family protein [bacterium]